MLTLRWILVAYAWLGLLLAIPAKGQTVTVGAGEIRHGQFGRQDFVGIEGSYQVGHVLTALSLYGRHGDEDDDNSGHPWVTLTAGPTVGPLAAVAGWQATPVDNYGRWSFVAGPRLDLPISPRVRLHVSHLWRERGYVRTDVRAWRPEMTVRLDLVLYR